MSLRDLKFKNTDFNNQDISSLSDRPNADGMTGEQLKARFDNIGKNMISLGKFNELVEELAALGGDGMVVSSDLSKIKYVRLAQDGILEVSSDGQSFNKAGSHGHVVIGPDGQALPQRQSLKFELSTVRDENGTTVVRGVKGDQGERGPIGPQGVQGVKGDAGKSAFEAAAEGGYAGAESSFNQSLSQLPAHLASRQNPHAVTPLQIGAATSFTSTATLGTAWAGSQAPYTQTVSVSGILSSDSPIIDVRVSSDCTTGLAQVEAWGKVTKIEAGSGSITAYCYEEAPTAAIPLSIKVVR